MAYTNKVAMMSFGGDTLAFIPVTARVWMMTQTLGNMTELEVESENVDLTISTTGVTTSIQFNNDADFSYALRYSGISLQDTPLVGRGMGWLFRSGAFDGPVPTDQIEVVAGWKDIVDADLSEVAQTRLPIEIEKDESDPQNPVTITQVTGLSLTLSLGGIDVIADGTTTKSGVLLTFRFTTTLNLSPASELSNPERKALTVGLANSTISFQTGASVLGAIEAAILNALDGVVLDVIGEEARKTIEAGVNAGIVAAIGRQLGTGGELPCASSTWR